MTEEKAWARVSLMGHTVLYGLASSEERYGVTGLRLDVPATATREAHVHWYAPGALFGVLELDEATVLKQLDQSSPWQPPAIRAYVDDHDWPVDTTDLEGDDDDD